MDGVQALNRSNDGQYKMVGPGSCKAKRETKKLKFKVLSIVINCNFSLHPTQSQNCLQSN
ncbi:hypothetical protein NMG60_11008190 [Bertholletia excelsa]